MLAIYVSEQQEELRYQVTYHTYLPSGGRLSGGDSVELCSWLNNTQNFAFKILAILLIK